MEKSTIVKIIGLVTAILGLYYVITLYCTMKATLELFLLPLDLAWYPQTMARSWPYPRPLWSSIPIQNGANQTTKLMV